QPFPAGRGTPWESNWILPPCTCSIPTAATAGGRADGGGAQDLVRGGRRGTQRPAVRDSLPAGVRRPAAVSPVLRDLVEPAQGGPVRRLAVHRPGELRPAAAR